jgi:singapore isolate B (sub-type 7) whole genome shotgun sequence assembly, scaffold_7
MKIMYILYDMGRLSDAFVIVELPKDITGGPWYSEQEFDVGFVDAVSQFVGKVLAEEVGDWVVSQVASRTGH